MNKVKILFVTLILGIIAIQFGCKQADSQIRIVNIAKDIRIDSKTIWEGKHYKINGNLYLDKGAELTIKNCTIEMISKYAREHNVIWNGGKLISTNSTIGGTKNNGLIQQTNLQLNDGDWMADTTTIRYCYGISFSYDKVGRLKANKLIAGEAPDSIIMAGKADVEIKDSYYSIAINVYANKGGKGRLNLPVENYITHTYDSSNLPGVDYRLKWRM